MKLSRQDRIYVLRLLDDATIKLSASASALRNGGSFDLLAEVVDSLDQLGVVQRALAGNDLPINPTEHGT